MVCEARSGKIIGTHSGVSRASLRRCRDYRLNSGPANRISVVFICLQTAPLRAQAGAARAAPGAGQPRSRTAACRRRSSTGDSWPSPLPSRRSHELGPDRLSASLRGPSRTRRSHHHPSSARATARRWPAKGPIGRRDTRPEPKCRRKRHWAPTARLGACTSASS